MGILDGTTKYTDKRYKTLGILYWNNQRAIQEIIEGNLGFIIDELLIICKKLNFNPAYLSSTINIIETDRETNILQDINNRYRVNIDSRDIHIVIGLLTVLLSYNLSLETKKKMELNDNKLPYLIYSIDPRILFYVLDINLKDKSEWPFNSIDTNKFVYNKLEDFLESPAVMKARLLNLKALNNIDMKSIDFIIKLHNILREDFKIRHIKID